MDTSAMNESNQSKHRTNTAVWKEVVAKYQQPSTPRAVWQIVNTLGPYALLWYLMYRSLTISWWLVVPLAILAGAFLVRIFIIFHDCGHGSYFRSRAANDVVALSPGGLPFPRYSNGPWEQPTPHRTAGIVHTRGPAAPWPVT